MQHSTTGRRDEGDERWLERPHDAQQVCQPTRFDYILDGPGDTADFAPYTYYKRSMRASARPRHIELAVKTTEREKQIAEERKPPKLDDKKLIQEAQSTRSSFSGRTTSPVSGEKCARKFADKNAVDMLQAAEAAAQSANKTE